MKHSNGKVKRTAMPARSPVGGHLDAVCSSTSRLSRLPGSAACQYPLCSGVKINHMGSNRRDQHLAILGAVRGPDEPALLHCLDQLGRAVVADAELALQP